MNRLNKFISSVITGQSGQALLAALGMLVLSGLVMAPFLSFVSTNLKAEKMTEENVAGYYAAESGVEDGIWRLMHSPPATFPYSYQLTGINGMTVNVTIEIITQIAGEEIGAIGVHGGWLTITKTVTYNSGTYYYELFIEEAGDGNTKVEKILVDFPPEVEYITGSTSGDFISVDPDIVGTSDTGITVFWDLPSPYPSIPSGGGYHNFQLTAPESLEGIEGHSFVRATREDVGTVWDADSKPYAVSAEERNAAIELLASIRTGVWKSTGGYLEISCWRLN